MTSLYCVYVQQIIYDKLLVFWPITSYYNCNRSLTFLTHTDTLYFAILFYDKYLLKGWHTSFWTSILLQMVKIGKVSYTDGNECMSLQTELSVYVITLTLLQAIMFTVFGRVCTKLQSPWMPLNWKTKIQAALNVLEFLTKYLNWNSP